MNYRILAVLITFLSLTSCKEKSQYFDWGIVKDNVYKNKFFDFTIPIPKDWLYDDKYSIYWGEQTNLPGNRAIKSSYDDGFLFTIDPGTVKETSLFLLKMPSADANNSSNIYFKVENAAQIDNVTIKNIDDYLEYCLKDAKKNKSVKLDSEEYEKLSIGGQSFFKLTGTFSAENGTKIFQQYYLTLKRGFGFGVFLSSDSKEELTELEKAFKDSNF